MRSKQSFKPIDEVAKLEPRHTHKIPKTPRSLATDTNSKDCLMFPTKSGLGVQLNYGTPGPNLFLSQYDPDKPWIFSRERDGGHMLQKVTNSTRRLAKTQVAKLDIHEDKDELYKSVVHEASRELIHSLEMDPLAFTDCDLVYDPTVGKMLDYGNMKFASGIKTTPVVAYVSGGVKDTLVIQNVTNKKEVVRSQQATWDMEFPTLSGGASLQFESTIKQIEICKSEAIFEIPQMHILVRTAQCCSVIRVIIQKDLSINLERSYDITRDDFGEEMSHITNNPFDPNVVAIIGVSGKWTVYKMTKLQIWVVHQGHAFVPEELSKFKRISWSGDDQRILLIGRTYVKEVQLFTGKSLDLISANQWTHIRDYARWETLNKFGFLLTARELIWVGTESAFKRILSWKHYLSPDDPSLSMFVKSYDDIQYVSLHSQVHPLIVVFQFKYEHGVPKSIRDPFIIDTDSKTVAQNFVLLPVLRLDIDTGDGISNLDEDEKDVEGVWFTLFKLSNQLELTRVVLSDQSASVVKQSLETRRASRVEVTPPPLDTDNNTDKYKDACTKIFTMEANKAVDDDSQIFQDFARNFDISKLHQSKPVSLKSECELQGFQNLEEFDNMLEQLHDHCKEQGVQYTSLTELSRHVTEGGDVKSFQELKQRLIDLWSNPESATNVTRDLALSLTVFFDKEYEEQLVATKEKTLKPKMKAIVDEWGHDYDMDEEEDYGAHIDRAIDIQTRSQPIITVTQSQSQPQHSLSILKRPLSQKFSQSTQTQKRKKKRVKGFA